MTCPACGAEYQPGDRFCGSCGERLADGAAPAVAVESSHGTASPTPLPAFSGAAQCPVCGTSLADGAARCEVCGFEPGASVVLPGGAGARAGAPIGRVRMEPASAARVCPIHGPLDPSWTRCPYCLKEGLEGRLPSGPVGKPTDAAPPAEAPAPPAASAPPASVPPRMEPPEAIVPAAPEAAETPSLPPPVAPRPVDLPQSSVGGTVAIRRRARVLAYLIEKEGEAAGRVHQLDDDFTDIGRDPRNHIVLTDVMISGFHARVERGPDGGFVALDRDSTNGTFLNGEQVSEPRPFHENDELRMGKTILVLKLVS